MSERYLWDGSGPPDPEIQALECLLAPLAHDGRAFVAPRQRGRGWRGVAAAAMLLLGLGVYMVRSGWWSAAPDEVLLRVAGQQRTLASGAWFVATEQENELELGSVGRMTLAVGTRLQVRRLRHAESSFYLERGSIEARVSVDARPRFFQVDTPATTCVDLGCRYTLTVDDAGDAAVEVLTGRVAFEQDGHEVFVPAGATCRARRQAGHGTPRFADASVELKAAFDAFDSAGRELPEIRRARAAVALHACHTVRDALSAWHLLQDRDSAVAIAAELRLEEIAGRAMEPTGGVRVRPSAAACERWKERMEGEWW